MPKLLGATLTREIVWLNIFYSPLPSHKLLFQPFLPISYLIGCSRSSIHHYLLTPSNFPSKRFPKSLVMAIKSLRRLRKLSRRSTMTRPWQECKYKQFSKCKRGEIVSGGSKSEASQRKGFHRWYCCRSGEWPARECQETCSGPWCFDLNSSCHSSQGSAAFKQVGQVSD